MAIAELLPRLEVGNPWIVALGVISALIGLLSFTLSDPYRNWPKDTAALIKEWPIIGSWGWWSGRWDFHREAAHASKTGTFGYHVGKIPVIGTSGDRMRKFYLENRKLDLASG